MGRRGRDGGQRGREMKQDAMWDTAGGMKWMEIRSLIDCRPWALEEFCVFVCALGLCCARRVRDAREDWIL